MKPLEEYGTNSMEIGVGPDKGCDDDCDIKEEDEGGDEEDEEDEDNGTHQHDSHAFEKALMEDIELILDFAAGLNHQAQFCDHQLLNALE